MKVIIDGKDVTRIEVLHRILKDELDFPDYYGENLNALWDCLTGWIEFPLTLVWKNFETSQKELGSDADDVLRILKKAQEELDGEFFIQIEQPSAGTTDRHYTVRTSPHPFFYPIIGTEGFRLSISDHI